MNCSLTFKCIHISSNKTWAQGVYLDISSQNILSLCPIFDPGINEDFWHTIHPIWESCSLRSFWSFFHGDEIFLAHLVDDIFITVSTHQFILEWLRKSSKLSSLTGDTNNFTLVFHQRQHQLSQMRSSNIVNLTWLTSIFLIVWYSVKGNTRVIDMTINLSMSILDPLSKCFTALQITYI